MGFTLPTATENPRGRANALISRKEDIESEIKSQLAVLQANDSTIQSPLVDADGFPRADIDVWAVRTARGRFWRQSILRALMPSEMTPTLNLPLRSMFQSHSHELMVLLLVARLQNRLITKFGTLTKASFSSSSLQPLAELVNGSENRVIQIRVLRTGQTIVLSLTPRQGWGGRGMLGCHIVPYIKASSS